MKNAFTLLALGLLFCSIWACKDEHTPITPQYANYANLKVGNYWIYDIFILKPDGSYIPQNLSDSSYVEKDTLIRGNQYFKLRYRDFENTGDYTASFLRDSLHYLVNSQGKILFSSENFKDTLFSTVLYAPTTDTIAVITARMTDDNAQTTVPAGNFTTKNYRTGYYIYPKWPFGGTTRPLHNRYAKEVGLVEQTLYFYWFDAEYIVKRLKRFGPK